MSVVLTYCLNIRDEEGRREGRTKERDEGSSILHAKNITTNNEEKKWTIVDDQKYTRCTCTYNKIKEIRQ
jgi:hypothetical protein